MLLYKDQSQTPKVSSCAQDTAKGALARLPSPWYALLTVNSLCTCATHGYQTSPVTARRVTISTDLLNGDSREKTEQTVRL